MKAKTLSEPSFEKLKLRKQTTVTKHSSMSRLDLSAVKSKLSFRKSSTSINWSDPLKVTECIVTQKLLKSQTVIAIRNDDKPWLYIPSPSWLPHPINLIKDI
jgi:hypothetical protein